MGSKYSGKNFSTEEFIEKAKNTHGDKYDYSLVEYVSSYVKIKIICKEHKIFEQMANYHLRGSGCPKCHKNYKYTLGDFLKKAKNVHGDKYDYSMVDYKNSTTKIKIICPTHDEFSQAPWNHLRGQGCPSCKESCGEKNIAKLLDECGILYEREKRFKKCKNIKPLPFDFYLPKYNVCIEYDGEQHFIIKEHFGGLERLVAYQKLDKIKNEYCKNNNIRLIRIRYDENIKDKLYAELFYS